MTRAEILKRLVEDMWENFAFIPVNPILEEHTLVGDLGFDPREVVNLMFDVELLFAFEAPDTEALAWTTVGSVVDTVERFFSP